MKKLVETVEVQGGFDELMGEVVTFFSLNYIYTGKLVGMNDTHIMLEDPSIVYETGSFDTESWKDAQKLPDSIYLMKACIEAFGLVK